MKLLRATQVSSFVLLCIVSLLGAGSGQGVPDVPFAATSAVVPQGVVPDRPVRAFPSLHLWFGVDMMYVAMFSPDTLYRTPHAHAAVHVCKREAECVRVAGRRVAATSAPQHQDHRAAFEALNLSTTFGADYEALFIRDLEAHVLLFVP